MRARTCFTAITALLCLTAASATEAEELKVLSAVGMRQVLVELTATFERATGHTLATTFDSGAMIVKRIEGGETADLVLVPEEAARQLLATGRALPGSGRALAASRVGVAVREGAPRPDISSPEALREALLSAKAVARPDPAMGGSSGVHIQRMLERLGIANALAPRTLLSSRPDRKDEMPAARVARGEADIALHQIQELLAVPGLAVLGPLPGELDAKFTFSAVVLRGTTHVGAAQELVTFLTSPQAHAVMRSQGMEPQ